MSFKLNEERIADFVDHLPKSSLERATKTHFPVQLPLAFPTPLHHVNLLTVLHLVHTTLCQPRLSAYLAQTGSDSHEIAVRGVMGLFLGSDEAWDSNNLLSAKAWKQGSLNEEKVAEFFGLEIMKEKDHPTLPVKVGERWKPGVDIAGDLVGMFKRLGGKLPMRCVGEAVLAALGHAEEEVAGRKGHARAQGYARAFCQKVIEFENAMADSYPAPEGMTLPAAPLRLLQDLSALMPQLSELHVAIPSSEDLSHLSPLPISLPLMIYLGLVTDDSAAAEPTGLPTVEKPVQEMFAGILSAPQDDLSSRQTLAVSNDIYSGLQTASVDVCRHIWGSGRFSRSNGEEDDWKHELSFLDVARICFSLQARMGHAVSIMLSDDA